MRPTTELGRRRRRAEIRRRLGRLPGALAKPAARRVICALAAALLAAGATAGLALAAGMRAAAPVNEGDPFENGDLVWNGQVQTYRMSGVVLQVDGLTDLGSAPAPFDYPDCLTEANILFVEGKGGGNWPGWGVSDYAYAGLQVLKNTRGLQFSALPAKGHCAQSNNATSYFGARKGYLNLIPELSSWSSDGTVYHGVFMMAIDNGHEYDVWDQATLGAGYVYADWEVSGSLEIRKRSQKPSLTKDDDGFSLADARFGIYRDRDCTDRVASVATDEDGNALKEGLAPGTYWVKETRASKGYAKTEEAVKAVVEAGKTTRAGTEGDYWREPLRGGYVRVAKRAADDGLVALAPARYSRAGAEYTLYADAACTQPAGGKIVTDAAGNGLSEQLDAGIYYAKETKASPGYGLDEAVYGPLKAAAGATVGFTSREPLLPGYLDLLKKSSDPAITDGNRCYSLAGARYGIFADSGCAGAPVAILATDAGGYAKSEALAAGRYWVRETEPASGYRLDARIYGPYAVGGGTTERVNGSYVADEPGYDAPEVVVRKLDGETGQPEPLGGASLEGCEFTLRYFDGLYGSAEEALASGEPLRTWVVRTDGDGRALLDETHRVGGDSLYHRADGRAVLPIGTVIIEETAAPEGYLRNETVSAVQISRDAVLSAESRYDAPAFPDFAKRGDLALDKYKHGDLARLAGIPFRITALDTGESHIIVTDGNGQAKTSADWNPHSRRTNANDGAVAEDGTVDESALDPQAGIWFGCDGAGRPTDPLDDRGALPYGTYRVQELRVAKNHAMQMIAFEFKVYRDAYEFHAELPNHLSAAPYMTTSALDGDTYTKTAAADAATTIIDRVDYHGLDTNGSNRFLLRAALMDAQTGGPVMDAAGCAVAAEQQFDADGPDGYVQVTIAFDSRACGGGAVVVFEELFDSEGNLVCAHRDIADAAQTVRIAQPSLSTAARDGADGDKLIAAEPSGTIIDAVACRGLKPGAAYTVVGSVNRVTDGGTEPLADADGNPITASREFTAEGSEAAVDVAFTVNAAGLEGSDLVLFEELWMGDRKLTVHADPLNADQTVAVGAPSIATSAADAADGDKEVSAQPGAAIADTVELGGLATGSSYTVKGSLHLIDGGDAEPLLDGQDTPIEAECSFTADSADKAVKLVFPFEAQALAGKSVVVYESLWKDGVLLASHADPADGAQTVTVVSPAMGTAAADGADGDKSVAAGPGARVVDTVSYEGLCVGIEYRLEGTLNVIGADGQATPLADAEGNPVAASTSFTIDEPRGTAEVVFEFDASRLAGCKLVAFESLLRADAEVLRHDDPDDEAQTVQVVPLLLASHAQDAAGGGQSLAAAPAAGVADTVAYSGAEPGAPLTLYGIMVDPATTLPLLADTQSGNGAAAESAEAAAAQDELAEFWTAYGRIAGIFGDGMRSGAPVGTGSGVLDRAWEGDTPLPHPYDAEAMQELLEGNADIAEHLITAEATVVPGESSGTAMLEYAFDASGLQGRAATSFVWAVNAAGDIVSVHADPGDAAQTVSIEGTQPGGSLPKTGDAGRPWVGLLAALGAVALLTGILAFRGMRHEGRRQGRRRG